jgi:hypothetical protein
MSDQGDRHMCPIGAMESPDGDYNQETKRLTDKSIEFARRASNMKVTTAEASMLYFTMIQPSMLYSAPAGTLYRGEADKINSNITRSILTSMGYNRNTPKRVVYGPRNLGGLGLMDIFVEQGAAKAIFLVRHLRTNRTLGKSLRAQIQWAQRVAGTEESILMDTKTRIPQLDEEVWITTLRQFLEESEMGIEIDGIKTAKPKREKDTVIMTAAEPSGDTDKMRINRCRTYLMAETIADVCNAEGTHITEEAMQCRPRAMLISQDKWPMQTRPGPKHRTAWKKFLQMMCKDGSRELYQPLGKWTGTSKDWPSEKKWDAFYDKNRDIVYLQSDAGPATEHDIEARTRHEMILSAGHRPVIQEVDVENIEPLDLRLIGDRWRVSKPIGYTENTEETTQDNSEWGKLIQKKQEWERDLLGGILEGSTQAQRQELETVIFDPRQTLLLVSDGGCKEKAGSYGWVIAQESTEKILWKYKGRARGSDMNSYRAEAYGMLSALTFLKTWIEYAGRGRTAKCRIRTYCDNKVLVDELQWEKTHSKAKEAMKPEFDMLVAIEKTNEKLDKISEMRYPPVHVKGHQDKTTPTHLLSLPARLNIRADKLATEALSAVTEATRFMDIIRTKHCGAFIVNKNERENRKETMTRGEATMLKEKLLGKHLLKYYKERFNFDEGSGTIDDVNFKGLRIARKSMDASEIRYVNKLSIGWLPTGNKLELYGDTVTKCHRCNNKETVDHIVQCPANRRAAGQIAVDLQTYLEKIKTAPEISRLLCRGVHRWIMHDDDGKTENRNDSRKWRTLSKVQATIGWHLAMRGWLSKQWAKMQQAWIEENNEENREQDGENWSAKVSLWLIRKSREFWTERNTQRQESSSPDDPGVSRATKETDEKIKRLYAREMNVAQRDRDIFRIPLETRLRMALKQKQYWLNRTTPHVNEAERRFRMQNENQQKDLLEMWDRIRMKQLMTERRPRKQERSETPTEEEQERSGSNNASQITIQDDTSDDSTDTTHQSTREETQIESDETPSQQEEQTMQKKEAQKKAWGSLRPHRTDAQVKAKKQKTKTSKRKDTAKIEEREAQNPEPQEETIKPVDAIRRGRLPKQKVEESDSKSNESTNEHNNEHSGSPSRRDMRG